jgi:hypothetical protein
MLSFLERHVARWLFRRLVGRDWQRTRLAAAMTELCAAARDEFTEDNDPTVEAFLQDCLAGGLRKTLPYSAAASRG